jgi:hypothetical protein
MFNVEDFAKQLPDDTDIGSIWALAVLTAWRESFAASVETVEAITVTDLAKWTMIEDDEIKEMLSQTLAECGVSTAIQGKEIHDLLSKIKSLADDRGLEILDLLTEARAGGMAISLFQKNATKQGIHEPLCVAMINRFTPDHVLAIRLKGDVNRNSSLSVRFDETGRVYVNSAGRGDKYSKDADIAVVVRKTKGAVVYLCSHKYARVAGGHQDNQLKDSAKYLRYALKNKGKPIPELTEFLNLEGTPYELVPSLVLDGEFFEARLDELREQFTKEPCEIHHTAGLIRKISPLT